uniref:Uncharacterized protein n=1 Tax=Lactuca sativa TaxID=4236 RepID=A0A9R1V7J2_LACSA|nr:hypothetical protein LSAT_V11C600340770 [Lactuca sativa]
MYYETHLSLFIVTKTVFKIGSLNSQNQCESLLKIGHSIIIQEYLQGNHLWLHYIKETSYDVFVKAHEGGLSGQAQAISLGIARALLRKRVRTTESL